MMNNYCKFVTEFLFAVLTSVLIFGLYASGLYAQTNDKCDQTIDCVQKFYKECTGNEFLSDFEPKLVDKFGITGYEDEMARMDSFYMQLNGNPEGVGYIVVYGGRVNKYGEFRERVKRLFTYIKERKYDPKRITVVNGGFREKFEFELWTSPIKNSFPPLSPTIDPEKVKFRGIMKPLATYDY